MYAFILIYKEIISVAWSFLIAIVKRNTGFIFETK